MPVLPLSFGDCPFPTVHFRVGEHSTFIHTRHIEKYFGFVVDAGCFDEFAIFFAFVDGSCKFGDAADHVPRFFKCTFGFGFVEGGDRGAFIFDMKENGFNILLPESSVFVFEVLDIFVVDDIVGDAFDEEFLYRHLCVVMA